MTFSGIRPIFEKLGLYFEKMAKANFFENLYFRIDSDQSKT